jgi:hypothetical protein
VGDVKRGQRSGIVMSGRMSLDVESALLVPCGPVMTP